VTDEGVEKRGGDRRNIMEQKKKRFTEAQENLISIVTILIAGIGPLLILKGMVLKGIPIVDISLYLKLLFPPVCSILVILPLTRNMSKALISAILATLLSVGVLIYLGLGIPP